MQAPQIMTPAKKTDIHTRTIQGTSISSWRMMPMITAAKGMIVKITIALVRHRMARHHRSLPVPLLDIFIVLNIHG